MNISTINNTTNTLNALRTDQPGPQAITTQNTTNAQQPAQTAQVQPEPQPANETEQTPIQRLEVDLRQLQVQRQIAAAGPTAEEYQVTGTPEPQPAAETAQNTEAPRGEAPAVSQEQAPAQEPEAPAGQAAQNVTQQAYQQEPNQADNPLLNLLG